VCSHPPLGTGKMAVCDGRHARMSQRLPEEATSPPCGPETTGVPWISRFITWVALRLGSSSELEGLRGHSLGPSAFWTLCDGLIVSIPDHSDWAIDWALNGVPQRAHCKCCGFVWYVPFWDTNADTLPIVAKKHSEEWTLDDPE
jgi:hypothetical protein